MRVREGEDPEHGVHDQRLPAVVGGLGASAAEGQQPQAGRVGGGEQGRDQAGDEYGPARGAGGMLGVAGDDVLRSTEDGLLGEEAAEGRDRGQREQGHGHRPVGVGDAVAQAPHPGHGGQRVGAGGVDDHAGGEEQERLEGAVGEEVEDGGAPVARGEGAGHVAELSDRRVGQDAFDVVLGEGGERGADHRDGGHDGEDDHRGPRGLEERKEPGDEVHTGGDHRRGVDQRGDGRRARHRVGKPGVQRELRRLARDTGQEQQRDQRRVVERAARDRSEDLGDAEGARLGDQRQQTDQKGDVAELGDEEGLEEAARASGVSQ